MTATIAWISAAPAALTALGVLLVPGLVSLAPLGLPVAARFALAGPVSVAILGACGVAAGLAGVPFAVWQPLVLAIVAGLGAWALRTRVVAVTMRRGEVRWWWLLFGWMAAAVLIAVVAFAAVPSPDRISQTYDNVFHLSAIAHILSSGDASSLTLRTLIETQGTWSFYPSGWHSIVVLVVQLTGASIPIAVNAAWLAVCVAVWIPGAVWLAQTLLRHVEAGIAALVSLPLTAAFAAMPYALLTWGTLYPTFLATALLPAAVALPVAVRNTWTQAGVRRGLPIVASAVGVAVTLGAVALAQPRVLVSWAMLIAPFAVMSAWSGYRAAVGRGGVSRRVARWAVVAAAGITVLAAGFAAWYVIVRLGFFERPLDDRLSGPQARASQSLLEGIVQVLTQSWPLGVGTTVTFPAIVIAIAVIVGLVAAARTSSMRWIVVSYIAVGVLFILAAGSDDVVAKLATAAWYKDRYRLSSVLPVLGVTLASLGMITIARWARLRSGFARVTAPMLAWVGAGSAALGMMLTVPGAVGDVFRMPETSAQTEVVSRAQIAFFAEAALVIPDGQRVLGDPWDGSALSWVFGGPEPVFPHVNGQWDPARVTVAWLLEGIETDPGVCAALDELNVRYVLYNPHAFGGGDPAGNHFPGPHAAVDAGLFTPVLTDGDSTLYRIDQCGPVPTG